MKQHIKSFAILAGLMLSPLASQAAVEYVRVCSLYGAGFHYIPGTDICLHDVTGDARVQTEGGTWRSLLPYPSGKWTTSTSQECLPGRSIFLGTFTAADFAPNQWNRKQTRPISISLRKNEFVSQVSMMGGFLDPRIPNRHGINGQDGICVRSVDPDELENQPGMGLVNPVFGNGMLPVACIANSRIVNMPAAYTVSVTSAHPSIDSFYMDGNQTNVSGPYNYGTKLVLTTDFGGGGFQNLTYYDARTESEKPLAGSVSVSICAQPGVR